MLNLVRWDKNKDMLHFVTGFTVLKDKKYNEEVLKVGEFLSLNFLFTTNSSNGCQPCVHGKKLSTCSGMMKQY